MCKHKHKLDSEQHLVFSFFFFFFSFLDTWSLSVVWSQAYCGRNNLSLYGNSSQWKQVYYLRTACMDDSQWAHGHLQWHTPIMIGVDYETRMREQLQIEVWMIWILTVKMERETSHHGDHLFTIEEINQNCQWAHSGSPYEQMNHI